MFFKSGLTYSNGQSMCFGPLVLTFLFVLLRLAVVPVRIVIVSEGAEYTDV